MLARPHPPLRSALRSAVAPIAAIAAAALLGCSDTAGPPPGADGGPPAAANTAGALVVKSVVGLEPLVGAWDNFSQAYDINDLGQVVGQSAAPGANTYHAVIWDGSTFPTDLGTLPGFESSFALAINATGTVVGSSTTPGLPRATRWVKVSGAWQVFDLGALPGSDESRAADVADNGDIVGASSVGSESHGVLWQNGIIIDLAPGLTTANAINNVGQVVGKNGAGRAALWSAATGAVDLGTLGGATSEATDINDAGEVTGRSLTSSGETHAFVWTSRKGMKDLGPLAGGAGVGHGINQMGQIVGETQATVGSSSAFVWSKGKFIILDVLPGYGGAGSSSEARAINTNKQIVGLSFGPAADIRATMWTLR